MLRMTKKGRSEECRTRNQVRCGKSQNCPHALKLIIMEEKTCYCDETKQGKVSHDNDDDGRGSTMMEMGKEKVEFEDQVVPFVVLVANVTAGGCHC